MTGSEIVLRKITEESEVHACFQLMRQLRPQMNSESQFLECWQRQATQGYCISGLFRGAELVALAGYRVLENLTHGRFLYVDDLVTDAAHRGDGHGTRLMNHLREEARALRCAKLLLDSAMSNSLGHRFYFRTGLLASALRFTLPIAA